MCKRKGLLRLDQSFLRFEGRCPGKWALQNLAAFRRTGTLTVVFMAKVFDPLRILNILLFLLLVKFAKACLLMDADFYGIKKNSDTADYKAT